MSKVDMILLIPIFGVALVALSNGQEFGRVVNGTDTYIQKYPYMVSLRKPDGYHTCGETLISPHWVLTGALCTVRPAEGGGPIEGVYTIQHSATVISPTATVNISQVAETIVHPNFYPFQNNSYIHDISLMRLIPPIYVSRYVTLPSQFQDVAGGTPATIIGWGLEMTGGTIQATLQEANVFVFSDEECRNRHEEIIHPSHICGGVPEGGVGQCNGDAGAPILVNGVEVGFGTWGMSPCAAYPYPDINTQVSYYREWIRQMTGI